MIIPYFHAKFTRYKYDNYSICFPLSRRRGFTTNESTANSSRDVSAKLSLAFISTQLGHTAAATLAEQQPKPTITSESSAHLAANTIIEYSFLFTYFKCRFE